MNDEALDQIRRRYEAATPGPWTCDHQEAIRCVAVVEHEKPEFNTYINAQIGRSDTEEDGEFIAHAREDIPLLMAEIEQLQMRVGDLKISYDHEVAARVLAELEIERLLARLREGTS